MYLAAGFGIQLLDDAGFALVQETEGGYRNAAVCEYGSESQRFVAAEQTLILLHNRLQRFG
ncbi:hypothetical protein D3C81_1887470 [compost metagenome]